MTDEAQLSAEAPVRPARTRGLLLLGVCGLLLCALIGVGYHALYHRVRLAAPAVVVIGKGASLGYVAQRLQSRGLIPSAFALKLYGHLSHRAGKIQVGEYAVANGMRPVDIFNMLVSGKATAYMLTIPEGKWSMEIAKALQEHWPAATGEFTKLVGQPQYWHARGYPITGASLEGYLFPDTYRIAAGATAEQIITVMLKRFQGTALAAYRATPPADKRSLYEVLVLASLVEAEAKLDRERPIIAGVYMNRLQTPGWRLDCDATLIFAKGERVTRVLARDKMIDSPYNTYRCLGLPPGPINNPGLKSFLAALHPAKVPYYFYVAQGDGSHIFSRTLAEQSTMIHHLRGK
ncbi:MAG TPA: endolytic transglycosylase MltG [Armatimonadota bacterium]|jgi:UPF0755 protein